MSLSNARRLGRLLAENPKATGGDAQRTRFQKSTESPSTLKEMGIDKKLSRHSRSNTGQGVTYPGTKGHRGGVEIRQHI